MVDKQGELLKIIKGSEKFLNHVGLRRSNISLKLGFISF